MDNKGQSAMEYLMTYGWAILVVAIVLVGLAYLGVFDAGDQELPGYSGFSVLRPLEWQVVYGPSSCTLDVLVTNAAGERLDSLAIGAALCSPSSVGPGDSSMCTTQVDCNERGQRYDKDVTITYMRNATNETFQSAGLLWGSVS